MVWWDANRLPGSQTPPPRLLVPSPGAVPGTRGEGRSSVSLLWEGSSPTLTCRDSVPGCSTADPAKTRYFVAGDRCIPQGLSFCLKGEAAVVGGPLCVFSLCVKGDGGAHVPHATSTAAPGRFLFISGKSCQQHAVRQPPAGAAVTSAGVAVSRLLLEALMSPR